MLEFRNMVNRCRWAGNDPLMIRYHDREWGVPVHNDKKLFEFLVLEGAQAGLSWITILKKRPAYRKAFEKFDFNKVARYGEGKVRQLLNNKDIVRDEFGTFNEYIWQFVDHMPIQNKWKRFTDIPAKTMLSDSISQDLKKRGFNFVGSTIVYAHIQATGMVNDHTTDCFRYNELKKLQAD